MQPVAVLILLALVAIVARAARFAWLDARPDVLRVLGRPMPPVEMSSRAPTRAGVMRAVEAPRSMPQWHAAA